MNNGKIQAKVQHTTNTYKENTIISMFKNCTHTLIYMLPIAYASIYIIV